MVGAIHGLSHIFFCAKQLQEEVEKQEFRGGVIGKREVLLLTPRLSRFVTIVLRLCFALGLRREREREGRRPR